MAEARSAKAKPATDRIRLRRPADLRSWERKAAAMPVSSGLPERVEMRLQLRADPLKQVPGTVVVRL
jgi:hypothetical protein